MNIVFLDHLDWDYDVATPLSRPLGGSQSALCYLATELAKRGHQVVVINGVASRRIVAGVAMIPESEATAEFLRQPHDAFIVLNGPGNISVQLRNYLNSATPLVLWTQHAADQPAMLDLANHVARESWDAFVCVSAWHRNAMIDRYRLPAGRTTVVGNAAAPVFEDMFQDEASLVALKAGPPVLAYSSTPFRGLNVLLAVFPELRRVWPDLELHVFSSMKVYQLEDKADEYHDLYDRCQSMAGVRYFGSLSQSELATSLRSASILAYPNVFPETSCIAVMEAMAAGLFVVTARQGALPETTMQMAELVEPAAGGTLDDFALRFLRTMDAVLRKRSNDPQAFVRNQLAQVAAVNRTYRWSYRAEQWEEAIRNWNRQRQSTTEFSSTPIAELTAARRSLQSGDLEAVEHASQRMLAETPNWAPALQLLGAVAYHRADWRTASAFFSKAIASDPCNSEYFDNLCMAFLPLGRHAEAEAAARSSLAIQPNFAESWQNLADSLRSQQRLQEAATAYERAIELKPALVSAQNNLGVVLEGMGRLDEAAQAYRRAIAVQPTFAPAHYNLAKTLAAAGQPDAAIVAYRQAIALDADFHLARLNLGALLLTEKRGDEAIQEYKATLSRKPDCTEVRFNLGNALAALHRLDEAESEYRRCLSERPQMVEALVNLGLTCHLLGKPLIALEYLQTAVQREPSSPNAWNNLGEVLQFYRRYAEAESAYQNALKLNPSFAEAWNNLANCRQVQGKLADAVATYRRAIALREDYANAWNNLGTALQHQGRLDDAAVAFDRAIFLQPDFCIAHSNRLMLEHYQPGTTLQSLAKSHARWNELHARPAASRSFRQNVSREPDRKLSVGFISADFGLHPVGVFLNGVVCKLHRDRVRTVAYNLRGDADRHTEMLKLEFAEWRDCFGATDNRIVQMMADDSIDILFDLAGHTNRNRLLLFARRPAPVQISWMGYVGTTGLEEMDYLLADRFHIPSEMEEHYRERVLRMPDGYVCFEPRADAPPVCQLPAPSKGRVTFGSFSNPAKINEPLRATWSRILGRLPNSRLLLAYKGWDDVETADRIKRIFVAHGVDEARIEMRGWRERPDLLRLYHELDIALDPFPYSGGLTTCEALWMGVPVVTLPGETFASRHSLSHLSNVGLFETIAASEEQYVNIAVDLANDLPRLEKLRSELRHRMQQSPLCDTQRFANNLEHVLRQVWREWVSQANST